MTPRSLIPPLRLPSRPSRVFTVSELSQEIKGALEDQFGVVVVQGEKIGRAHV